MVLNSKTSDTTINVSDIVFRGVISVINNGNWTGTMSSLNAALNRVLSKKQRAMLPKSPSALRVVVNRVANRIRNRGVSIKFGRTTDSNRTRFVKFVK